MRFVGVDLAWGQRSPTGLAVLDDDARLLHVGAVRTDDEIAACVASYDDGGGLWAGIDAPLVVTNPTGSRLCERALSADFRRFEAGTHPSNTARPEFVDGPRGARVAVRLGLAVTTARVPRRAVEVYPHAAIVALLGLERTLKYKSKPGRELAGMRAELLRLVALAEALTATPGLLGLRAAVEEAPTKAALRRAEDPVDAVVCAHVAWLAWHEPTRVTTYGDDASGFIVTPSLPVSTPGG